MKKEYLEGGRICTAHGVAGALKIEHLCDSADVLTKQKTVYLLQKGEYVAYPVTESGKSGKFVTIKLDGINDRETAQGMRGTLLYLHRDNVPKAKGAMFIQDMLGLQVRHAETDEVLGVICDVPETAGRRYYTVKDAAGREVMIPDVPEFIKEINEDVCMKIMPIPGLFDEADEV